MTMKLSEINALARTIPCPHSEVPCDDCQRQRRLEALLGEDVITHTEIGPHLNT